MVLEDKGRNIYYKIMNIIKINAGDTSETGEQLINDIHVRFVFVVNENIFE